MTVLTPEILLTAYSHGIFPMAESQDDPDLFWVDPEWRGIFPLDEFHLSRSMRKLIRKNPYTVTVDKAFRQVMKSCAKPAKGRENTWINRTILDLYTELHQQGHAHSIEVWRDDTLVGGLYGVSFNAVFCGESMFSIESNTSKLALCYLVARLNKGGFHLLDTQFLTDHLASLGAVEISREEYHRRLDQALSFEGDFYSLASDASSDEIIQSITQTS
ncbi:leucyl/phenylalanyl-tRNA--protein transferase [Sneathiella sp. P13V-1]|uniref:leucyl/phenylalanyl-tRNA--protein transferase n=1 Tax=Sneathiella sp. P13V-1 TaxID=2697366 RepID=UPI00187B5FB0|nr:leucyl/phenylalanyl-tRNA--protein transferase [Sneathiella sp. P13V-1]MBE7637163.1 leucyl/phenylalanyl-tRNA--protein transferase [Sneathiella sp. P13V-1]